MFTMGVKSYKYYVGYCGYGILLPRWSAAPQTAQGYRCYLGVILSARSLSVAMSSIQNLDNSHHPRCFKKSII